MGQAPKALYSFTTHNAIEKSLFMRPSQSALMSSNMTPGYSAGSLLKTNKYVYKAKLR